MLGNAAEWCEDWFEKDRVTKVLRGQCWRACHRTDLLLTARMKISPKSRTGAAGFRCVLVPGEEK
jgi:formylglycine-generating enzyme required for sulfatase activity